MRKSNRVIGAIAAMLTVVAAAIASSASWWLFYQPKSPNRILKK